MSESALQIRLDIDELDLFSRASHDRNPLHLSDAYARKTPYGQRVVFGILGALVCLARLPLRNGVVLSSIELRFPSPMFVGVGYSFHWEELSSTELVGRLYDGRRALVQATAEFRPGAPPGAALNGQPTAPPLEARSYQGDELRAGQTVEGRYEPDWKPLQLLLERIGFTRNDVGRAHLAALLWSSYLVGMELPGRQALFAGLSLQFDDGVERASTPLQYRASIKRFDRRFNRLTIDAHLAADDAPLARGSLESFVRPEARSSARPAALPDGPDHETLDGTIALVIGGSRGLGAAIAQSLALEGCNVFVNYHKSREEAEQLQGSVAHAPGTVSLLQGDASDRGWCEEMRTEIVRRHGRLDLLVCSAAPPVLPLWLEPTSVDRIKGHIEHSVSLVTTPLAVCLETLSSSAGRVVVISSEYVHTMPVEWPHYVSAKAAVEAMTRMAARQFPAVSFLVVRPPRLLTDLSSSPFSFEAALPPETVAQAIVRSQQRAPAPGSIEVLETFAPGGPVTTAADP